MAAAHALQGRGSGRRARWTERSQLRRQLRRFPAETTEREPPPSTYYGYYAFQPVCWKKTMATGFQRVSTRCTAPKPANF